MRKYHYKFVNRSLKQQMSILLIFTGCSIIGIMMFSFISYYNYQYDTLNKNNDAIVYQTIQSIENNYQYFSKLSTSIAYNEDVQSYLNESKPNQKFELSKRVSNLLISTQNIDPSILDISILGTNGNFTNVFGDIAVTYDLLRKLPEQFYDTYFFGIQEYLTNNTDFKGIIAAKWIYPLDIRNKSACGAVFIAIDPERFFGTTYVKNNSDVLEMLFIDNTDQLVLGNESLFAAYSALSFTKTNPTLVYDHIEYMYKVYELPKVGYRLIALTPKSAFSKQLLKIVIGQYFLTFLVFAIIISILIYFISRFISTINRLVHTMQKISAGNRRALKERISIEKNSTACLEATMIVTAFNEMLDQIDNLNKDIFNTYTKMYESEIYAKKAELAYLRSQINPHFLYNTLAVICGMSTECRTEEIIEITNALARILRYSIKGNEFVTFKEELEIVKSYLMIQSVRFEDRFTLEYQISDEILNAKIPRMIIQPFVENSIVHGLEKALGQVKLQIGALRDPSNNTLVVWVFDTGPGIKPEKLENIRQKLLYPSHCLDEKDNGEESIGLSNVNSRIKLYYGETYHLHIDSDEAVGTNIQIRIPFTTEMGV